MLKSLTECQTAQRRLRHQSQPCRFKILVGRPARLQATRSLEPGRSSPCELFPSCAGVHVDFHAHRHFDNPRSFPGHWVLHLRHIRRDVRAEPKVRPPPPTRKSYQCCALRRSVTVISNFVECRLGGCWIRFKAESEIDRRRRSGPLSNARIANRYLNNFRSARPARVFNSLASRVPSLSGFAALKRCSTTARYSSAVSVPSWSGSAAANSLALNLPASSRLSRVPS